MIRELHLTNFGNHHHIFHPAVTVVWGEAKRGLLCSQESTFCSIWCSFIVFILEPSHKVPFSLPPRPPHINWKETIQSSARGEQLILLNTCPDCDCCTIIACPMVAFSFRRTLKRNYWCQGILLKHLKKIIIMWMNFPFWHLCPGVLKTHFCLCTSHVIGKSTFIGTIMRCALKVVAITVPSTVISVYIMLTLLLHFSLAFREPYFYKPASRWMNIRARLKWFGAILPTDLPQGWWGR